jgi:hypothetical protein
MCTLIDPDGHIWSFATHTGKTFEYKPEAAGASA